MHDPMTVAFEIRSPIPRGRLTPAERRYYPSLITIWHVDPEADGSDDSCDWFGDRRLRENGWYPDAVASYNCLPQEAQQAVDFVWFHWRHKLRHPWWKHPRWHVWHWQIQVHPLQDLKRWLFSRCAKCGRRFSWGYAPVSTQWGGRGPRWFNGEPHVYHHKCI